MALVMNQSILVMKEYEFLCSLYQESNYVRDMLLDTGLRITSAAFVSLLAALLPVFI